MRKLALLIFALLLTAQSSASELENKAFLLGHTSGLSGDLTLLPLVERSPDLELKKAYAQNLVLKLNSIRGLNPVLKDLDAVTVTPLCEAATVGAPFLIKYSENDILTRAVIEYLTKNKEEIVASFSKQPLAEYGPSPCAESLRKSAGQNPNNSFKADGVPPRP